MDKDLFDTSAVDFFMKFWHINKLFEQIPGFFKMLWWNKCRVEQVNIILTVTLWILLLELLSLLLKLLSILWGSNAFISFPFRRWGQWKKLQLLLSLFHQLLSPFELLSFLLLSAMIYFFIQGVSWGLQFLRGAE